MEFVFMFVFAFIVFLMTDSLFMAIMAYVVMLSSCQVDIEKNTKTLENSQEYAEAKKEIKQASIELANDMKELKQKWEKENPEKVEDLKRAEAMLAGKMISTHPEPVDATTMVEMVETPPKPPVIKMEYISDQLRNYETVTMIDDKVCPVNEECFVPKLRLHEDKNLYACQTDGLQCYILVK